MTQVSCQQQVMSELFGNLHFGLCFKPGAACGDFDATTGERAAGTKDDSHPFARPNNRVLAGGRKIP